MLLDRGYCKAARHVEVAKAVEVDAGISLMQFSRNSLNKDSAGLERGIATLRGLGLSE